MGKGVRGEDRAKEMATKGEWSNLVDFLVVQRFPSDLYYFYLGKAAEALGHRAAAGTYYQLATSTAPLFRCGTGLSSCQGYRFPADAFDAHERVTSAVVQDAVQPTHPSPLYETAAERAAASEEHRRSEHQRERDYYAAVIGKEFWLKPGDAEQLIRNHRIYLRADVGRDRELRSYGMVIYSNEIFPKQTLKFEIVDCLSLGNNVYGKAEPTYQIRLEDGTLAYMSATNLGHYTGRPRRWAVDFDNVNEPAMIATTLRTTKQTHVYADDPVRLLAAVEERERELAAVEQRKTLAIQAEEQKVRRLALARASANARKGGVRIGMSQKQVLASSWGKPEHVNRTISVTGITEQWVYSSKSYLYFQDGLLTTIQN